MFMSWVNDLKTGSGFCSETSNYLQRFMLKIKQKKKSSFEVSGLLRLRAEKTFEHKKNPKKTTCFCSSPATQMV